MADKAPPREPTPEMIEAVRKYYGRHATIVEDAGELWVVMYDGWRDAAPAAPAEAPHSENVMAADNNMAGNTNAAPVYELCAQICDEMADRGPPEMAFAAAHCAAAIREAAPIAAPAEAPPAEPRATPQVDALLLEINEGRIYKTEGPMVTLARRLESALAASRERERHAYERAAQVCDSVNNHDNPMTAKDCADAIRALAAPDSAAKQEDANG